MYSSETFVVRFADHGVSLLAPLRRRLWEGCYSREFGGKASLVYSLPDVFDPMTSMVATSSAVRGAWGRRPHPFDNEVTLANATKTVHLILNVSQTIQRQPVQRPTECVGRPELTGTA